MSLRKFGDFEHNLEEEDKQRFASNVKSAKKKLLSKLKDLDITETAEDDILSINVGEHRVLIKIKGFEI